MEFNFSFRRLLLFGVLVAVFAVMGGFNFVSIPEDGYFDSRRVTKAWFYCIALFLTGATGCSLIDHFVGTMERSNLRALYIIIGALLMLGAFVWLSSLKNTVEEHGLRTEAID